VQSRRDESWLAAPVIIGLELGVPEAFPALDFNRIFSSATACPAVEHQNFSRSGLGFDLSPSAPRSNHTCRVNSFSAHEKHVYAGNLEIPAWVESTREGAMELNVIAASGYLDAATGLLLSTHALMIAGGDLHIGRLEAHGSKPLAVTLISAAGVVVLDQIHGPLKLRVIAWLGAYLPRGYEPLGNELPLPFLERWILGLEMHPEKPIE